MNVTMWLRGRKDLRVNCRRAVGNYDGWTLDVLGGGAGDLALYLDPGQAEQIVAAITTALLEASQVQEAP
jgi:hypothetical protein